jgi:hypothetical protein
MVIIEGLLMEVVSILIQHPLNPLYPVVKDEFQFKPLNFTQKFLNTSQKILWPGELFFSQCRLHVPEKPEVKRCQVRTVKWMGYSNDIFFSQQFSEAFQGGRDSCQGANLADENAICDGLEILRAAVVPKHD